MMKMFSIAILILGLLFCASETSRAQSGVRKFASDVAEHYTRELASRGIQAAINNVTDKLTAYFTRNKDEMNKPKGELAQRLAACRRGSSDPLCEALRTGPEKETI